MTLFPRLCLIGLNYAQPFLIQSAVHHIEDPSSSKNDGYGLVGATIFIYLGLAVCHLLRIERSMLTMSRSLQPIFSITPIEQLPCFEVQWFHLSTPRL